MQDKTRISSSGKLIKLIDSELKKYMFMQPTSIRFLNTPNFNVEEI